MVVTLQLQVSTENNLTIEGVRKSSSMQHLGTTRSAWRTYSKVKEKPQKTRSPALYNYKKITTGAAYEAHASLTVQHTIWRDELS